VVSNVGWFSDFLKICQVQALEEFTILALIFNFIKFQETQARFQNFEKNIFA
jgi:hypothetical protein